MKKIYTLTPRSFAHIFDEKVDNLHPRVKQAIQTANFKYSLIEGKEYEQAILHIIKTLDSRALKVSGPQRLHDWEKGWKEHLLEFNRAHYDRKSLIGKFANRGRYVRLQGKLIKPGSDSFESDFVSIMRLYLFDKYFKKAQTLYEFGAGTGVNLVAASEMFPQMKLIGLDWAKSSVDIINALKEKLNINISGKRFDLFNPDKNYQLDNNSAILTIGTLEQLGENFKPFIHYLLHNKPQACIHLETLYERYDQDNLLDYLAVKYLEQRNYLRGFLPILKSLEKKKKIKILQIRRTFGSTFHEGYMYTVWKPL